jgi:hypothetical protein
MPNVRHFYVHEYRALESDHCKLSLGLKVKYKVLNTNKTMHKKYLRPLPKRYLWRDNLKDKYVKSLNSPPVMKRINDCMDIACHKAGDIENLLAGVNDVYNTAAMLSLNISTKNNNRKSKPWYNRTLAYLKQDINKLSHFLSLQPRNNFIRGKLFMLMRQYNNKRRQESRKFRERMLAKLEDLHVSEPKEYWKLLEKLKNTDTQANSPAENIEPNEWLEYYTELTSVHEKWRPLQDEYKEKIKTLDQIPTFNDLSYKIKGSEITEAIKGLKNNKATGPDNISNEMIKHSASHLKDLLLQLFNAILSFTDYPKLWAEGFITVIH